MSDTSSRKRQSKGTPVGGQFAAENKAESEVDLDATEAVGTVGSSQEVEFRGVTMTQDEKYWVYDGESDETIAKNLAFRSAASSTEEDDRVGAAMDRECPTYYLNKLADDSSPRVRGAVASNERASIVALDELSYDRDRDVARRAYATLGRINAEDVYGNDDEWDDD